MFRIIGKLKGRGLDELHIRGAQKIAAFGERLGWSGQARIPTGAELFAKITPASGSIPLSAETLLASFQTGASPSFFAAFADRAATVSILRERIGPRAEERAIKTANRIIEGRFDLLGLKDLDFGDPIDWHLEPVRGKQSPLIHWSRIDYLDPAVAGDKKIIWELNRHQYFLTLGRAYWLSGDERYARTIVNHISQWIACNPPKMGINWASSLEVAFRAISWLWALHFLKESPALTPAFFLSVLKLLHLHARHLETYLSTYFSPNTHLTGEALGLFYLGTLLPRFRASARWRDTGRAILLAELDRHIKPDGVYFEQSSYYHRYTTDFYTHFLLLSRLNGGAGLACVENKLVKLLDHLMHITRPDGTSPLFGDDDGGRLTMIGEAAPNDFRAALSTGAALFARPDYKYVSGGLAEETIWLLGSEGARLFDGLAARPPDEQSRAFPGGGYYVMRDGWTKESNFLLVDCGPHGAFNCGHAHADALALDLAARGRTLLVDPGTYTYTGSIGLRDQFRLSAAHNTLTLDGQSSSVPAGPFAWQSQARANLRAWAIHERFDFFEGEHDGYARLAPPAIHRRGVFFLKGDYWIMRDSVATAGPHSYDLSFHYPPDASPRVEAADRGATALRERPPGLAGLEIFAFSEGGQWRIEDGWVSRCYGERSAAPVGIFSKTGAGEMEIITFLIPRGADEPQCLVQEIEASGGRSFECRQCGAGAGHDVVIIRRASKVESAGVVTDGEWVWMRFAAAKGDKGAKGELRELALRNAHRLTLNGREIFAASRVLDLAARRAGGDLIVEFEPGAEFRIAPLGADRVLANGAIYAVETNARLISIGGRENPCFP